MVFCLIISYNIEKVMWATITFPGQVSSIFICIWTCNLYERLSFVNFFAQPYVNNMFCLTLKIRKLKNTRIQTYSLSWNIKKWLLILLTLYFLFLYTMYLIAQPVQSVSFCRKKTQHYGCAWSILITTLQAYNCRMTHRW